MALPPKDFQFVLTVSFAAVLIGIAGCSRGEAVSGDERSETTKAIIGFESSCRLNSFSWITRQPQEAGIALADKPCLGCTIDFENHFCDQNGYNEFVAVLADFRSVCKANGDTWMLMEPIRDGLALPEKMCWGCMADEQNHFCSIDEYIKFEGATGNAT